MRGQNREHLMSVLAVALFLVWSVFQPQFAMAVATECISTSTLQGPFDSIVVPPDESCTLDGAVIVNGDVVSDGADTIVINLTGDEAKIGGSVKLKHVSGEYASSTALSTAQFN